MKMAKSILKAMDHDKRKTNVDWDEANIILTSEDRGTRMKIDEPKTPFHYYDEQMDTDVTEMMAATNVNADTGMINTDCAMSDQKPDFHELYHRISDAQQHLNHMPPQQPEGVFGVVNHDIEDEDYETEEEKGKRKAFEKHRNQHYNMKEQMKKARELLENDDDEEEEEEEENERRRRHGC